MILVIHNEDGKTDIIGNPRKTPSFRAGSVHNLEPVIDSEELADNVVRFKRK